MRIVEARHQPTTTALPALATPIPVNATIPPIAIITYNYRDSGHRPGFIAGPHRVLRALRLNIMRRPWFVFFLRRLVKILHA